MSERLMPVQEGPMLEGLKLLNKGPSGFPIDLKITRIADQHAVRFEGFKAVVTRDGNKKD